MRQLIFAAPLVLLAACTTTTPKKETKSCKIGGRFNWEHSDPALTKNLCRMSRELGPIIVTSSCRTRKQNMGVKNSYHLYSRGCKAADLFIKGVKGRTILVWWARNVGGGRGSYRCRPFVHVDTGPNRTWHWNTKCKR